MKEERLAILSMVEKGVISVEEAERLLKAVSETKNDDSVLSKAGESISSFAKTAAEKTEEVIDSARPHVKKAMDEAAPKMKKLGEKANEFTNRFLKKKAQPEETADVVEESDFVENVCIIPVAAVEDKESENSEATTEE